MNAGVLFTAFSGWALVALLATTITLPYLLRRPRPGGLLTRMRPHYWAGFAIPVIAVAHLTPSMSSPWIRTANTTGLDAATLGLILILIQVILGARLRRASIGRRPLRQAHLLTMIGITVLVTAHVALNTTIA